MNKINNTQAPTATINKNHCFIFFFGYSQDQIVYYYFFSFR